MNNLDNYITGNDGQDQFPDKIDCQVCYEVYDEKELVWEDEKLICKCCAEKQVLCG